MKKLLDLLGIAPRRGPCLVRAVVGIACLLVGGVFIRAGLPKIDDPAAFALSVFQYRTAPDALVNGVAIFLPWLELVCGVAFILLPRYRPAAGLLLIAMLLLFAGLQISVMVRGIDISCGCFSVNAADQSRVGGMTVARNGGLILLAALGVLAHAREPDPSTGASEQSAGSASEA